MRISDLPDPELADRLDRGDLLVDIGPFVVRMRSNASGLAGGIASMYRDFSVRPPDSFADFHVRIARERDSQRWFKPIVRFYFDGYPSFVPLPAYQAFPMLEWGLNWCVAAHCHQYLIIHAAVIACGERAVLLPAPPGHGKSTLCAGLVSRGWRLLSDELALLDMDTGMAHGMARPINLKNASIDVIRAFAPSSELTTPVPNTNKGTVALMRPPTESVLRVGEPARPTWIVLPKFIKDAPAKLEPHNAPDTFMLIAEQSFNYVIHGERGFESVGRLIEDCECYEFTYSDLSDAEQTFSSLCAA